MPRPFTFIMAYYRNPTQLKRQLKHLAKLPEDIRQYLHVIITDDGSPEEQAEVPKKDMPLAGFKMFRVEVDIPWNWLTCRNIGAYHAETGWLLLTDIDHELPEETARRIIYGELMPENVYRFSRRDAPKLTDYKPHPNSWLLTKAMFHKIGGYDERLSGLYGSDGEWRDRVNEHAADVVMLPEYLIRVPGEFVPDARTRHYPRKEGRQENAVRERREQIARDGGRPLNLSFPFHQTYPPVAVSRVA